MGIYIEAENKTIAIRKAKEFIKKNNLKFRDSVSPLKLQYIKTDKTRKNGLYYITTRHY